MPIYEYVCEDCQQEFETLVRGQEQPSCLTCGSHRLTRLLSVAATHCRSSDADRPLPGPVPCGRGGCGLPQCEM